MTTKNEAGGSRRDFLKAGAVVGGTALAGVAVPAVFAQGSEEIKVGLVGCGGRGTGAAEQCMRAAGNVKLWAMGDAFSDRLQSARRTLQNNNNLRGRMTVTDERCFTGLDAYRQVIASSDLVILATPPGFRPQHIEAVINAGKHLFTEKPVAVDGPGIRTVLAAYETANRNNLKVVAGTQRRYQTGYMQSMQRIHDGQIGTITSGRCYWNQGSLWHRARGNLRDLEWQIRNWLYFTWLSGDHICEQHVHNLDVINWAMRAHPTRARGMGGRQVRTGPEFGHIFDHFAVELEYPNGAGVQSMCRQIDGCENNVSEMVTGTRGSWYSPGRPNSPNNYRIVGDNAWTFARGGDNEPYLAEHVALINAIRNNQPRNDLRNVAESTLTAIMGRTACYTGQPITWEQALNSQERLMPNNLAWDMTLPVPPVPRARS